MKKLSFLVVLVMISLSALAQTTDKLPAPDKQVAMTLYEALQTRHSVRSYQNKDVDNATLAQALWAACGYSREAEKKITAASALNRQDIEVYVIKAAGAYRYDVESNALVQLSGKDLRREVAAGQQSVASAACARQQPRQVRLLGRRSGSPASGYAGCRICVAEHLSGMYGAEVGHRGTRHHECRGAQEGTRTRCRPSLAPQSSDRVGGKQIKTKR